MVSILRKATSKTFVPFALFTAEVIDNEGFTTSNGPEFSVSEPSPSAKVAITLKLGGVNAVANAFAGQSACKPTSNSIYSPGARFDSFMVTVLALSTADVLAAFEPLSLLTVPVKAMPVKALTFRRTLTLVSGVVKIFCALTITFLSPSQTLKRPSPALGTVIVRSISCATGFRLNVAYQGSAAKISPTKKVVVIKKNTALRRMKLALNVITIIFLR